MAVKKIAVIGAGPAGLAAAHELAKSGVRVTVYEASGSVGGMAKTIELWKQKVDIGPHRFFSDDTRVNRFWLEIVQDNYAMVDRLTRIFYKKRFFYYPLKAFNALFNLGVFTACLCVMSYARYKIVPLQPETNFENWVTNRFGKRLYTIFFKTYSEKLWGISCKTLDADFAAQRIKKLSLWEAIKNAVFSGGATKHKTLVDQFAYPYSGTGYVYEEIARRLERGGSVVKCNAPIHRVVVEGNQAVAIELEDGCREDYDEIVSSMPITNLVERMEQVPERVLVASRNLTFRNTIVVFLRVDSDELFEDQWLYVHSPDVQSGRITNFRNWVPSLYGEEKASVVALEFWCYSDDDFWKLADDQLIEQAKEELAITGLSKGCDIVDGFVYRIERSYPVYATGYKEHLTVVEEYLSSINGLTPIGRYGAFKYNNQDHSILMGILAAENIIGKADHNLWDINTDYEYQESSRITKTGLEMQEG